MHEHGGDAGDAVEQPLVQPHTGWSHGGAHAVARRSQGLGDDEGATRQGT